MRRTSCVILATLSAGTALGDESSWRWSPRMGGADVSDGAGEIRNVRSTFDSASNELTFRVVFGGRADGFSLVLSDRADALSEAGKSAIVYVGTRGGARMSAYAYNGRNSRSFRDGDARERGRQDADLIHSSLDSGWVERLSVRDRGRASRVFSFTIDVGEILEHLEPERDGLAMGFADGLGVVLESFDGLRMRYARDGSIRRLQHKRTGFFRYVDPDLKMDPEDPDPEDDIALIGVPLPTAAGMTLLALGLIACRRVR